MQLTIPYEQLSLVEYEGAGNKTPVLDLSRVARINKYPPAVVRRYLESDRNFRQWLIRKGRAIQADSVMIYYAACHREIDFITFIGEPNAAVSSTFSTMCGNGIRALALHILLTTPEKERRRIYIREGIRIWAGSKRNVFVESINVRNSSGIFRVEMGPFVSTQRRFGEFLNPGIVKPDDLSSITLPNAVMPVKLWQKKVGLGFNGRDSGEPHLVILYDITELETLCRCFSVNSKNIIHALRQIVCVLGETLTFAHTLFPQGINVNLGIIAGKTIYMTTHERNLLPNREVCHEQQREQHFCQCNTMACGTGGAAVANIAWKQRLLSGNTVETIHPGGTITYMIHEDATVMIGSAEKKVRVKRSEFYAEN